MILKRKGVREAIDNLIELSSIELQYDRILHLKLIHILILLKQQIDNNIHLKMRSPHIHLVRVLLSLHIGKFVPYEGVPGVEGYQFVVDE